MQVRNYQKELDQTIERIQKEGSVPSLLLHACCAPCSSYVLSYLSEYFRITVCFYNPNITSPEEFEKRAREIERACAARIGGLGLPRFVADVPGASHKISLGELQL